MTLYSFIYTFRFSDYTKSCLLTAFRNFSAVLQEKLSLFFGRFRFFGIHAEVLSFKPEFPEKFAGFTEASLFFSLFWTFTPGAKHPCTAGIGRTVFAGAGFKVMVRAADPEVSPVFFPGLLYNIGCLLPGVSSCPGILFISCCESGTQNIPPVCRKT